MSLEPKWSNPKKYQQNKNPMQSRNGQKVKVLDTINCQQVVHKKCIRAANQLLAATRVKIPANQLSVEQYICRAYLIKSISYSKRCYSQIKSTWLKKLWNKLYMYVWSILKLGNTQPSQNSIRYSPVLLKYIRTLIYVSFDEIGCSLFEFA